MDNKNITAPENQQNTTAEPTEEQLIIAGTNNQAELQDVLPGKMQTDAPATKPEQIFSSIADFRNRATKQDMQEMENYINSLSRKSQDFKCDKYPFSYSAASQFLREQGFLGGTKPKNDEAVPFIIEPGEKPTDYTSRTFTVEQSVLDRIDRLSDAQWLYSKKAIINKLLDDALKTYGY